MRDSWLLEDAALCALNVDGDGRPDSGLSPDLVYPPPVDPHRPPVQEAPEADCKQLLQNRFGIVFNPCSRWPTWPSSASARCC